MSGGSYDYLCSKDASDLLGANYSSEIMEEMRNRLIELKMPDIANELTELEQVIIDAQKKVTLMMADLADILKEVEWYDSYDSCIDDVLKEAQKWYEKHNLPIPEKLEDPRRKK